LGSGSITPTYATSGSTLGGASSAYIPGVVSSDPTRPTISVPSTIEPSTTTPSPLGPFEHPTVDFDVTPSLGLIFKNIGELPIYLHMDEEMVTKGITHSR